MVLILKWGGELTPAGRIQAEELGRIFRCMYPGGQGRHLSGSYHVALFPLLFFSHKLFFIQHSQEKKNLPFFNLNFSHHFPRFFFYFLTSNHHIKSIENIRINN